MGKDLVIQSRGCSFTKPHDSRFRLERFYCQPDNLRISCWVLLFQPKFINVDNQALIIFFFWYQERSTITRGRSGTKTYIKPDCLPKLVNLSSKRIRHLEKHAQNNRKLLVLKKKKNQVSLQCGDSHVRIVYDSYTVSYMLELVCLQQPCILALLIFIWGYTSKIVKRLKENKEK